MTPAIEMKDVVFRFWQEGKRNILDHASLTLRQGGITIIMGASGCGKSTLAAVTAGLYPENGGYLQSGEITLFGQPLKELDPARRSHLLSMMFQNPDLQFCMDTLRRELQFCMENQCVPPEEMDEHIEKAAERLHMQAMLDRPLSSLSGGEKQKAALCCLSLMESRCILLDEPFANIDPSAADEIVSLLLQLKDEGRTIIAIDHRLDHWMNAADEIILLGEGARVLARGIIPETLNEYRPLFEQEGIFFPGEETGKRCPDPAAAPAIRFEKVSVPVELPRKKLFKPQTPPVWLMQETDASFPAGQISAVLGPSGCGKTTTFLAALKQHPYTGQILIGNRDLSEIRRKDLYQHVGIVFQNPANQFITQNVEEEVCASIRVWQPAITDEACREQAAKLLESYGLLRQKKYSPYMLSQGQQRRLAVLSVLAGQQRILLLDEPTYGQDQRSTQAMMRHLREKTRQEHLTVILITHDHALARAWADKIYRFEDRTLKEVTA